MIRCLGGLALVLVVAVGTACAGPRTAQLYTVTATVMQGACDTMSESICRKPGQPAVACATIPLTGIPIGCGGVPLDGLDASAIPGAVTYPNGVIATPPLTLVGIWNGRALVLTEPAVAAREKDTTPQDTACVPAYDRVIDTAPAKRSMQRLMGEEKLVEAHGIQLLEFGLCNDVLQIEVGVADQATVKFLTERYAPVKVVGWLRPVARATGRS